MGYKKVGVVAAMPEEVRPLLRALPPVRSARIAGFTVHTLLAGDREVNLIRSGMGPRNATAATKVLLEHFRPDLLISTGFGGGITPGAVVGDIVVAHRLLHYTEEQTEDPDLLDGRLAAHAWQLLGNVAGRKLGTFITATGIRNKEEVASTLAPTPMVGVVDMESYAVARTAAEAGIPFLGIRAISDGADEELGFAIEEIADSSLDIRIGKILLTVARKPWILPQLARLAKNSKVAGKNLAVALAELLARL